MNDEAKQDIASRKRKVALDNLTPETVDQIAEQIGQKIGNEVNELCDRMRKMLSIYGLDLKLSYIVHKIGEDPLPKEEPKKRARKKKS